MEIQQKKGFTLIELLIVIGIIGVLAAAVVVVLNPAQLLAQARDSTRISDLASISSALALYAVDVATPTFGTTAYTTHSSATDCDSTLAIDVAANPGYTTDGFGWVEVVLDDVSGGSPIPTLPRDPSQSATQYYCYLGDNTNKTWELVTQLESIKFTTAPNDREADDGGDNAEWYEIGSDPGLDLL